MSKDGELLHHVTSILMHHGGSMAYEVESDFDTCQDVAKEIIAKVRLLEPAPTFNIGPNGVEDRDEFVKKTEAALNTAKCTNYSAEPNHWTLFMES